MEQTVANPSKRCKSKVTLVSSSLLFSKTKNNTNTCSLRSLFDFESIYNRYPKKLGKGPGIKRCQKENTEEGSFVDLGLAVDRFAAHHAKIGTDPQYIPYFSTFMSSWRDWLDPNVGRVDVDRAKKEEMATLDQEMREEVSGLIDTIFKKVGSEAKQAPSGEGWEIFKAHKKGEIEFGTYLDTNSILVADTAHRLQPRPFPQLAETLRNYCERRIWISKSTII